MADSTEKGQPRYYGVIKDSDTAIKFINAINDCMSDDGKGVLSSYISEHAATVAMNVLYQRGTINEVLTSDAQSMVFTDLTLNAAGSSSTPEGANDCCITIAKNLFLVVRPYNSSLGTPVTRLFIKHTYKPETGDPITTVMDLGQLNSDNRACACAYEVTKTKSYDILVKLAWCGPDTATSRKGLEKIFACLNVNCYQGTIESSVCYLIPTRTQHSEVVFGYKAPYGGFVLHKMNDKDKAGSVYGITIFNTDGTPLYTWAGNAMPFTIVKNGQACYVNMSGNRSGLGKHIVEATEEYAPIQMAVMAPIFCPSVNDSAALAKWIQQSPHDYSYFDRSGHVSMNKGKEAETAWFVDHGICLWDGYASDYDTNGETIPDSNPLNLAAIYRPDIPNKIPYADDFTVYLDGQAGLSTTEWMSANDDSDMIFSGGVSVGTDAVTGKNYVRLPNSTAAYGYGKLDFAVDLDHDANGNDIKNGGSTVNRTVLLVCGRLNITTLDINCKVTGINPQQQSRTTTAMLPLVGITNKTASFKEASATYVYVEYYSPALFTYAGQEDNVEKPALFFSDNQTHYRSSTSTKTFCYDSPGNFYLDAGTTSIRFIASLVLERSTSGTIRRYYQYKFENGATQSFYDDRGASGYSVAYNGSLGFNNVAFAESTGSSSVRTSRYLAGQAWWRNGYGYNPVDSWSALAGGDKPDISIDVYFAAAGNYITANHLTDQFAALDERFFPQSN